MKKILVAGANGQLGSELKSLSDTNFAKINEIAKFTFTDINELDLTNKTEVQNFIQKNKFDYVINCAAYTNVDKAESDKDNATAINANAVKNIIESLSDDAFFIHISTDYVFDGKNFVPYTEDMPTNPTSVYGETKLKGELHTAKHNKSMTIRTSWLYSNFGHNFAKTMLRLAKERNEIKVVFDQVGTPTYAKDLAKSIIEIITQSINSDRFIAGTYHFSNEGVCSWYDFALYLINKINTDCKVIPIESVEFQTPVKRPNYSVLNKKKIKENFNLNIPHWTTSADEFFQNI